MSTSTHEHQAVLADVDFAALKRIAAAERAEAIKAIGRAIADWLRSGLRLRYSDDALTHPAAGALCGC